MWANEKKKQEEEGKKCFSVFCWNQLLTFYYQASIFDYNFKISIHLPPFLPYFLPCFYALFTEAHLDLTQTLFYQRKEENVKVFLVWTNYFDSNKSIHPRAIFHILCFATVEEIFLSITYSVLILSCHWWF